MRIALVHRGGLSTFKARDLAYLRRVGHDVTEVRYESFRDGPRVVAEARRHDVVLAWFADAHAAFAIHGAPRRVPVVVVVGGYEVVALPEIPYGTFATGGWLARATVRHVLRRADLLLPVSEATRGDLVRRASPRGRVEILPNAVDPEVFRPGAKQRVVLTVANAPNAPTAAVKGLPRFVEAARRVPDADFVLAGPVGPEAASALGALPPNVRLVGPRDPGDLATLYASAKVYAQLSSHESFGVALAEAMSAACVPVVTEAGALPEVVGEVGRRVPLDDDAAAAAAIRAALDAPAAEGERARARVVAHFSLDARGKRLAEILGEAVREKGAPA